MEQEEAASALAVARAVVDRRLELFERSAPDHVIDGLLQSWLDVIEQASDIANISLEAICLRTDLLVAATRCLEAWKDDSLAGGKVFGTWALPENVTRMYGMILNNRRTFRLSLNPDLRVRPAMEAEHETINAAKLAIREHQDIINLIRQPETRNELEEFLDRVKFFVFTGDLCSRLLGLSCPIGTRVYISAEILEDARRGVAEQNPVHIIAHELCHNWSRWNREQPDMISPEKNAMIRTRAGAMVEAGDFFEERVYDKVLTDPHPFCVNTPIRRMKY